MVNLSCKLTQCDEIWLFVGCKQKNVKEGEQGRGDVWTWTAIDSETKLVPCWYIGSRDAVQPIISCTIWPLGFPIGSG